MSAAATLQFEKEALPEELEPFLQAGFGQFGILHPQRQPDVAIETGRQGNQAVTGLTQPLDIDGGAIGGLTFGK